MDIFSYAEILLKSDRLEDKLTPPPSDFSMADKFSGVVPDKPGRPANLKFSDKKSKIPRLEHLWQDYNRAITMHHFANHELMAIELFAWALLKYPSLPEKIRRDIVRTISEEQKHLRLYLQRMEETGISFGERPLNYIFWKQTPLLRTPEQFFAVMALSFEGANLDYAMVYERVFSHFEDSVSAEIMRTVYRDELKHVTRGLKAVRRSRPDNMNDWDYYQSLITFPFTPRRAKGYSYFPETRKKTGLDNSFIENLGSYRDEYSNRVQSPLLNKLFDPGGNPL